MIGIYLITNNANGKMYVGQSVNLEQRMREHRSKLSEQTHSNEHLQSAWNKYGEDTFSFEVIEVCDKEELDEKERHYIKLYGTQDRLKGYNIEGGGSARKEVALETREKLRQANLGKRASEETKQKMSASSMGQTPWNKGKSGVFKHTEESRQIMREHHSGGADKKQVLCVETGEVFESIRAAANHIGKHKRMVSACCNNKPHYNTAGGYHWRYL